MSALLFITLTTIAIVGALTALGLDPFKELDD